MGLEARLPHCSHCGDQGAGSPRVTLIDRNGHMAGANPARPHPASASAGTTFASAFQLGADLIFFSGRGTRTVPTLRQTRSRNLPPTAAWDDFTRERAV
jgi:hypothetical protein